MTPDRPRVLVLHHVPPVDPATGKAVTWRESDAGVMAEIEAVAGALRRLDIAHRVVGAARLADVPQVLAASDEEVVFNLVEDFVGSPGDANYVPALCEASGKGCTGSATPCLVAALDKGHTKALLMMAGLACPAGATVPVGAKVAGLRLPRPPYIVKPIGADASEGIDGASVVRRGGKPLAEAVRRVHEEIGQAALVEHFIDGREVDVSIIERAGRVEALSIAEIDFSAFPEGQPRIVDYAAKWLRGTFEYQHTPRIILARLTRLQAAAVCKLALAAWQTLGCRDYARVDLRLDARGRPFILEVNPNPDVAPDAGFAGALEDARIPYEEFVELTVANAAARMNKGTGVVSAGLLIPSRRSATRAPAVAAGAESGKPPAAVVIRWSELRDRDTILRFLAETGFFRSDEMAVAQEVLDEALAKGPGGHYQSFVAAEEGRVVGWVCIGPTPCTLGTFDIYWIGVAPGRQGRGIGTVLMQHAENLIRRRAGRIAVVETSGRSVYDSTRRFYLKLGYCESARVGDFYAPGDDKIIYTKCLA